MRLLQVVTAIALGAVAMPAAAADKTPRSKPGYELVKEWDFGAGCSSPRCLYADFYTRYAFDGGKQDHLPANGEWQRYRTQDNHRFEDGALKLVAQPREWRSGGFESGMIRTKLAQKYGYFEVRAKLPKGRGLWPTIELQPEDAVWPPSITIATMVDNREGARATSYHMVAGPSAGPVIETKLDKWNGYTRPLDLADDYHVFAVDWTPERVTHFVDGVKVASQRFLWKHENGRDAGPAQLVISLAVGGKWAGDPLEPGDFPAALAIDYIRIYHPAPASAIAINK